MLFFATRAGMLRSGQHSALALVDVSQRRLRSSMQRANAPALSEEAVAEVASKLKAKRRTGSKRALKPLAPKQTPTKRVQRPWKASPIEASSVSQDIEKTIELLTAEIQNVRQLPQNSTYARHRMRLLDTALKLADQRR